MNTPQNDVEKDISELENLNWKISSFTFDSDRDPSEKEDYHQDVTNQEWLVEKIAEKVVNDKEYATAFNNKASENIKKMINEQDLENLKHGRFYDADSWKDAFKDKANRDLEALDKGKATYEELAIDEKRKDPKYAKAMDGYITAYNAKVTPHERFDLNSYKDIATAKRDLENWDNNKITALELGRKLKSPEYRTAFEDAVRQTYKPGLEKEFGHFDGYKGTLQQNVEQFVKFRMQGIETTYKHAEKYQQLKLENAGKAPGINQEKDLSR